MFSALLWLIPGYERFYKWMWPEHYAEDRRSGEQINQAMKERKTIIVRDPKTGRGVVLTPPKE